MKKFILPKDKGFKLIFMLGFIVFPLITTIIFLYVNVSVIAIRRYPLFLAPLLNYQFAVENLPFNLYVNKIPPVSFYQELPPPIPEIEGVLVDISSLSSMPFELRYTNLDNRLYFTVYNIDSLLNAPFHYLNLIVESIVELYRNHYENFYILNSVQDIDLALMNVQNYGLYGSKIAYLDIYNFGIFLELSNQRGFYDGIINLIRLLEYNNNRINTILTKYIFSLSLIFVSTVFLLTLKLRNTKKGV
ncbi:MAG: hypothetical protein FWF50_04935 [Defluviitaleaceae bacterium]|nr:hypothetical protein [Defluviitaleaceae bacterium]